MGKGWAKDSDTRFFTFPVELLRGAFDDIAGVCSDALNYAIYVRCKDYNEAPDEAFLFFGLTGNANESFARGEELCNSFIRPVLVSVNKAIVFDFMENPKTDFEIAVFCAFCGLRSIIGTKPFAKSNNGLLIARMFGYATTKEFEELQVKPTYFRLHFSTVQKVRYQLTDKILKNELMLNWGLKYYANQSKGFYVSFSLDLRTLATYVEKARKSNRLKKKQAEQKQIIEQVKKQILGDAN